MSAHALTSPVPPAPPALRLHPLRRLVPSEFFCVLYGVELRDVLEKVESGDFYPAFNLSTNAKGYRRRIHLWRGVVETYAPGRPMPKFELDRVIAGVLPPLGVADPSKATVRASDLCMRWSCTRPRPMMLVRACELREVGKHDLARESPRISRDSIVAFMRRRAL
jgi:hypothetical protein